ncbi:MAG: type IX secretion system outer membrane channel protein PorV [Vicingaceae bacterium]
MYKISSTFFAFILLISSLNLNAQKTDDQVKDDLQLNTITTAVPFLLIAPDSRAGALGDAGAASSPDANSMHWNLSKLAFIEKNMGVSFSYTPWLRKLVPDINLAYLSGYKKLNDDLVLSASLRYFSLGDITFTDNNGNAYAQFRPNEFALDAGVAQKLSDRFSGGLAVRYIYSNLTGGISVQGTETKPGQSFAVDVSTTYRNEDAQIFGSDAIYTLGVNISNLGAKMAYSNNVEKDFIPMNFRLGNALTFLMDDYNKITFMADFNKLLVPTPPIYATDSSGSPIIDPTTGNYQIAEGKDPNVSVANAVFQSWGDAPGGFKEELREINISGGMEYWYNDQFAVRIGYFHEHATKGNRKYLTVGAGLKYSVFGIDFAYLIPTTAQGNHPLANTIHFSLLFDFDAFKDQNKSEQ